MTGEENVQNVRAAFEMFKVIADAIRDIDAARDNQGIPNGELYAMLMRHMSYQTYSAMISKFQGMGLITLRSNLIRWTGPREFKRGVGR